MKTKLFLFILTTILTYSCTTPEDRGLRPGVIKIVNTPIVKPFMIDTTIIIGDTIQVHHRDTLTLAVVVR